LNTLIRGGKIITPFQTLQDHVIVVENGKIKAIIPFDRVGVIEKTEEINAEDCWITPGLIDVHVHGCSNVDTMDATHDAYQTMDTFFASRGVTSYLPTTGAAPNEDTFKVIETFKSYQPSGNGAFPVGLHLEGPYLNEERKGAQPSEHLVLPDPQEYKKWFDSGVVKMMTVAPELEGAKELIQYGVQNGIEFAVGHSVATYNQMQEAAGWGLRQATHTFNGMDPLHHRKPGVVGAVLSDERIYAQIIPDGVHVHPAVVKLLVGIKGVERTMLITDAIRASGLGDGEYPLLGQIVTVKSGIARVASGSLAGSIVTMDAALRNVIDFCGISELEAVRMATFTPAEALGLTPSKGYLRAGADADITIFDRNFVVMKTLVGGKIVYEKS
jgi:N-acetylglucosamine-6-phosphate deacetylase